MLKEIVQLGYNAEISEEEERDESIEINMLTFNTLEIEQKNLNIFGLINKSEEQPVDSFIFYEKEKSTIEKMKVHLEGGEQVQCSNAK